MTTTEHGGVQRGLASCAAPGWLQAPYACQTADEQAALTTGHLNGIGFNKFDAPILSDIAARARRYGSLTPPQARLVLRKLAKYAG